MFNYRTLSSYLFVNYLKYFVITTGIVIGFLSLANVFDIMQSFKGYAMSLSIFLQLVLLKVPATLNDIVPLISFISTLLFLKKLNKYNELIIILDNGISIIKLLIIPIVTSLLLGGIFIVIVAPVSTYTLQKLDRLKNKITNKRQTGFAVLSSNILFFEDYKDENRIIKAQSLNFNTKQLNDTIILILNSDNILIRRIDAEKIILEKNNFNLINAKVFTGENTTKLEELVIPTNLSIDKFAQRYLRPQMIYIWDLPAIMSNFLKSGFPVTEYKIYYYKQIFKPLSMVAMVVLASCFLSFNNRNNHQSKMITLGLLIGVILYASLEIGLKVLVSNGIDPILAILLPIFLIIMMGNFVILHFY